MEIGLVKQIDIDEEMRQSYLSYAMSVIVSRALPDARDGLKPVQRRILYAMYDMGLGPNKPHRKSARVVGEVLGKYHPHSDSAVYDAMVRMAQDFSLRYVLVDGQGNFGSVDGDAAAAMRYTEARLSPMGFDMLEDIGKETVDFVANFDDSMQEPSVLPATAPNLLINGGSGIAVGIATSIPPHNLNEVLDALQFMLQRWEQYEEITLEDLMRYIKGPDFPTGGLIYRYRAKGDSETDALTNAYATGRGRITVRAKVHVEQMERNKSRLVITELPYQVNKTNLISRIADLHRAGRLDGLTDLRDESDRNGTRIIIETTRNVEPEDVLAQLFKTTPLESTFSIIMVALVNEEPRVLTLKQALRIYLDHRLEIVRRRSEYDLMKAQERAHILEGLMTALDNLDEVIALIRKSRTADTARTNLRRQFGFTSEQAQAVLDMPLRRLASLERRKIQDEHKEMQRLIAYLQGLLTRPELMRHRIAEELQAIREKYGDTRRSQIVDSSQAGTLTAMDLLPDEQVWVMVGEKGTVARTTSPDMVPIPSKPAELPLTVLEANTQDVLYLFSASGQAVSLPVYQLPQSRELGKGTHWADLTGFSRRQHVVAALVLPAEAQGYLFMTTLAGVVKRVRVEDLPGIQTEPFDVMNVPENDALGWARLTGGEDDVMLATAGGQVIRFKEDTVRPMGLPAGGVMGIRLAGDTDGVIGMDVVDSEGFIWSITDNGLAKASPLSQYPTQGRYGQGVINLRLPAGATEVVAALIGVENTELVVMLSTGRVKKMYLNEAVTGNRPIKPQEVIDAGPRSRVTGAIRLRLRPAVPEEREEVVEQLSLMPEMPARTRKSR